MRIRTARKIADSLAPGWDKRARYPRRRFYHNRWSTRTLVEAFYALHHRWRSLTTVSHSNKADHYDAGRNTTEDWFRGNRLAQQIYRHTGVKVATWMPKPEARKRWIEDHGRFP